VNQVRKERSIQVSMLSSLSMISSVTAMMRKRIVTKERTNATLKVSNTSSPSWLFEGSATGKKKTSIVRLLCFLVAFVAFLCFTFLNEIKQLHYFSVFGYSTKAVEIESSVKMETSNSSTVSDSLESFAAFEQGYKQVKDGQDKMKQEIVRGKLVPGGKISHHKERKIVKKKDKKGDRTKLDYGGNHPWDGKVSSYETCLFCILSFRGLISECNYRFKLVNKQKKKKKNKVNHNIGFKFKDS
jgi:hypothetical protein